MDLVVFATLNGWSTAARPVWAALAAPWAWLLLAPLVAWVAWRRRSALPLLLAVLAVGTSDVLVNRALKPAIARERPCRELPGVALPAVDGKAEGHCGSGFSMPSAHASNTMALAAALGSPALVVVSAVVGVSRVVSGQHWPSDVVVGWGVGAVLGLGIRAATRRTAWT